MSPEDSGLHMLAGVQIVVTGSFYPLQVNVIYDETHTFEIFYAVSSDRFIHLGKPNT